MFLFYASLFLCDGVIFLFSKNIKSGFLKIPFSLCLLCVLTLGSVVHAGGFSYPFFGAVCFPGPLRRGSSVAVSRLLSLGWL